MAFSLEEKVDLLLKKIAFGKTKTDTSEKVDGFGEGISSPLFLRGDKVLQQAASIPSTPAALANIVQAYQGADVVQCTAASGTTDTNITGFKRAWSTGQTDWIPAEFSAGYTVEVYVGPSGWNGTDAVATTIGGTNGTSTGANVFRVVPGVSTSDWYFDYQAGILYWTNEDEAGGTSNQVGGSTALTSSIASSDVVYIKGYKYIGIFGVGGSLSAATNAALGGIKLFSNTEQSEAAEAVSATADRTYGVQFNSNDEAVVNVPWVDTNTTDHAAITFDTSALSYLSLSSQEITVGLIDLANHVTGDLPNANLANASVTIGSTEVALGASVGTFAGLTSVTSTDFVGALTGTATKATAIAGGVLGSVPYQSDANTTSFLAGNTATTNLFMRSVGDGTDATAPTFAAVTKADVGLGSVENTALSTWAGSSNITTLGAITSGSWTATDIGIAHGGTGQSTAPLAFAALANIDHGGDFTIGTQADDTAIFTGHGSFGGNLTVAGNLNVIGAGTYINLQQENVYMKDALITLGNEDDGADADFADAAVMAAGTLLGIEAYKQNHDNSAHPSLVFDSTVGNKYWAIDNKDHASSVLTRVARVYKLAATITAQNVTDGYFTITHQLNHKDVIVQVRDATQNIVFFTYTSQTVNTVRIAIGGGITAGNQFNVVVVG
jgi:hypothetical protein